MKIYRKLILLCVTAFLAAACGDEKDYSGDYGQIKVPDTRELEQTVAADDTQTNKGVTFTTEGAWTSTITSTRADAPDWITISPDHGDAAGSYTIRIALRRNGTGAERTASITIVCGTSRVTITVRQGGETDEPVEPTVNPLISKIECFYEVEEHPEKNRQTGVYHFEYDTEGRIASYKWDDLSDGLGKTVTFSYPNATTLNFKSVSYDQSENFTVTLDHAGRATEMRRNGHSDRWTFSYDAEGRCIRCDQQGADNTAIYPNMYSTFGWSDGDLTTFDTFRENGDKASEYCYKFAYDTDYSNNATVMSLDLNALLFNVNPGFISEYDTAGILLAAIGRLGVRSAHLTKTNMIDEELPAWTDPDNPELLYYYEILPGNVIIQWELDNHDRISRAFCTTRVLCVVENRTTGRKDLVDEKCYTRRETYNISY